MMNILMSVTSGDSIACLESVTSVACEGAGDYVRSTVLQ